MRYAIIGATVEQVKAAGGTDIREAKATGIIFATLTPEGAARLRAMGAKVTPVGKVTAGVIGAPIAPPQPVTAQPIFTPASLLSLTGFDAVRNLFDPPLSGEGINVAIVDTGIRESHEYIQGGVVYRQNFTGDPMADGFDHGTAVAALVRSMAPGCGLLNMKVLDSKGEGTEEELTLAIDDLLDYHSKGGSLHIINLSLGSPDDGNPNNPVRIACREAIRRGIYVRAAAGNSGPAGGTIMSPACERYVGAIGACGFDTERQTFTISAFSSRGPTLEGLVKPDYVCFGENIIVASSASDTATVAKSGTSFACPQASGIVAISLEAYAKKAALAAEQYPQLADVIQQMYQQMISPTNSLESYIPRVTVKPQGILVGKDNDYGWGLPWGPLAIRVFQETARPAVDFSAVLSGFVAVAMLGMVARVME